MREETSVLKSILSIGAFAAELYIEGSSIWAIVTAVGVSAGVVIGWLRENPTVVWASIVCGGTLASSLITLFGINSWHARKDREISGAFLKLHQEYVKFENEAVKIGFLLALNRGNDPLYFESLQHLHEKYLTELCETAVTVFNAKNIFGRPVKANIKLIYRNNDLNLGPLNKYAFCVSARSQNTPESRKARDKKWLLAQNYMYSSILDEKVDENFYLCPDLKSLVKKLKADPTTAHFVRAGEPSLDLSDHYQSFLTVPIMGVPGKIAADTNTNFKYKQSDITYDVYGLICVDSVKKNAFNNQYDLDILTQLSIHAFSSWRIMKSIEYLAKLKNRAIISTHGRGLIHGL